VPKENDFNLTQIGKSGTSATEATQNPAVCNSTQAQTIEGQLYSKTFDRQIPFLVTLPPCVNPSEQTNLAYATLYLLHGLGSDEGQWISLGLEKELHTAITLGISQFIVIMPKIPDMETWPSDRNATFFSDELIPTIDSLYPTLTDKQRRAIGGRSRGAAWALRIGLEKPAYFAKIGLHSLPLYDNEVNHWTSVLSAMELSEIPQLFMDSGKNEKDLGSVFLFDERLTSEQIPHEFHLFEGDHNDAYWNEHLPIYLEWYAQGW
jgi:enterochelin esterase-like enzyme